MDLSDTIVAVSSPTGAARSIVRLSGPDTLSVCREIFTGRIATETNGIVPGSLSIEADIEIPAQLYLFFAPYSYTGQTLAELHVNASAILVEALVALLLAKGLRLAEPGEFTARAYLNGKLDLTQAEAVNEIITGSNRLQLDAAEGLLRGRLRETTDHVRTELLDCLSLIEAGLDFSEEGMEFISPEQAIERLARIKRQLEELLTGSIRYESLIDLPAVGIAGAPNAGKSSLLNALLGQDRSIVSEQLKTTRDVLSGVWTTERFQCVLFDCAGLLPNPEDPLDQLAQGAAIEALRHCQVVLFCVDLAKPNFAEDLSISKLIEPKQRFYVATKSDLLAPEALAGSIERLAESFNAPFAPISAKTGYGLQDVEQLVEHATGQQVEEGSSAIALTSRHRQIVTETIANVVQAADEIGSGAEEVAAMMIRTACQGLSNIEQHIDEQVLDRVFGQFCIGK